MSGRDGRGHERSKAMTQYRITCSNNSDARDFRLLDEITRKVRHNGGKLVVAEVDSADTIAADAILDASHKVASYEKVEPTADGDE